jgi:hypothetical protein
LPRRGIKKGTDEDIEHNDADEKGPRRGSDSAQNTEADAAQERDLIRYDWDDWH